MYRLAGFREPVLVASTDGVGTKLKVAAAMHSYETIGEDLVNACVNDVIVSGAKPLFFLDYISVGVLEVAVVEALLEGMSRACTEVECALVGGETAQMPGLYAKGDFDVAGFAVGAVEKSDILDGSTIKEGDVILGLSSTGLHTNGYSLVRDILGLDDDPSPLREFYPELGQTLGESLLVPHRSYYQIVRPLVPLVKAMAHITGGGLVENVPRVLPDGLAVRHGLLEGAGHISAAPEDGEYFARRDVPRVQHGPGARGRVRRIESGGDRRSRTGGGGCRRGDAGGG
jgi:phosphoribosylformylglycinamidine cyclo-ligase